MARLQVAGSKRCELKFLSEAGAATKEGEQQLTMFRPDDGIVSDVRSPTAGPFPGGDHGGLPAALRFLGFERHVFRHRSASRLPQLFFSLE